MSRPRFWSIYLAAWLPYAISYYVLFRRLSYYAQPMRQTIYNIVPAAALGLLILPWTRLFSWKFHRTWWFYPGQLSAAVGYSFFWYLGVLVVSSIGNALTTHHFVIGYFSGYAMQWQFFSGLMIYGNIAGVLYVLEVNQRLQQEERRRSLAEALQARSELAALRAQLNPHFLFNTLNSIMALAGPGQPRTMEAIAGLAAMLRYTLNHTAESEGVSLCQELTFTDQYLALESLRLGDRLHIVRDIAAEACSCRIPPLTLQPLVENAIRHGIAPRSAGGTLTLQASLNDAGLLLSVQDDGLGCDSASIEASAGLGLRSIRQRLELFTEGRTDFSIEAQPGRGFRVTLSLPFEPSKLIPQERHASLEAVPCL